jgi:hypothetical protein
MTSRLTYFPPTCLLCLSKLAVNDRYTFLINLNLKNLFTCVHMVSGSDNSQHTQCWCCCPWWVTCCCQWSSFFFSNSAEAIVPENKLKPLKPVAIKVETWFRYHFGLLRPKKYSQQKLNHFQNQPRNRLVSFTVNTANEKAKTLCLTLCKVQLTLRPFESYLVHSWT